MSVALSTLTALSLFELLLDKRVWKDVNLINIWLLINNIDSFLNVIVETGMPALALKLLIEGE